jgi:phosphotransferase system  glucose/maltose/N-acetylglucosamine-specific IIC component
MRQKDYRPVLEDWIWHAGLPILAYASLVHAGVAIARGSADTEWIVGGASLLLVFIGIHNAWDTVTWITLVAKGQTESGKETESAPVAESGTAASASYSAPRETEQVKTQ